MESGLWSVAVENPGADALNKHGISTHTGICYRLAWAVGGDSGVNQIFIGHLAYPYPKGHLQKCIPDELNEILISILDTTCAIVHEMVNLGRRSQRWQVLDYYYTGARCLEVFGFLWVPQGLSSCVVCQA